MHTERVNSGSDIQFDCSHACAVCVCVVRSFFLPLSTIAHLSRHSSLCVYICQDVGLSSSLSQALRIQPELSEREAHSRVWESTDKNERTVSGVCVWRGREIER